MKKAAASLAALLILATLAFGQDNDFSVSVGVGLEDFNNSFVSGLSGSLPLGTFVQGEVELFYYRMPVDRSHVPGLAITSTSVNLNAALLLLPILRRPRTMPYLVLTAGTIYTSETWKWSVSKVKDNYSDTRLNIGLGAGVKYHISNRSGLRFDLRWLRFIGKDGQVPRISVGYFYQI